MLIHGVAVFRDEVATGEGTLVLVDVGVRLVVRLEHRLVLGLVSTLVAPVRVDVEVSKGVVHHVMLQRRREFASRAFELKTTCVVLATMTPVLDLPTI